MTQIYRSDHVDKPTRPAGTTEGSTPTSFRQQESGDHGGTTNPVFETTRFDTWRIDATRVFVRELNPNPVAAPATAEPVNQSAYWAVSDTPVFIESRRFGQGRFQLRPFPTDRGFARPPPKAADCPRFPAHPENLSKSVVRSAPYYCIVVRA